MLITFNFYLFQLWISCHGLATYPVKTLSLSEHPFLVRGRSGQEVMAQST